MSTLRKLLLPLYILLFFIVSFGGSNASSQAVGTRSFMSFQGVYSNSTVYTKGDMVTESGTTYVSIVANNLGYDPASNSTKWVSLLSGSGGGSSAPTCPQFTIPNYPDYPADGTQGCSSATIDGSGNLVVTGSVTADVSSFATGTIALTLSTKDTSFNHYAMEEVYQGLPAFKLSNRGDLNAYTIQANGGQINGNFGVTGPFTSSGLSIFGNSLGQTTSTAITSYYANSTTADLIDMYPYSTTPTSPIVIVDKLGNATFTTVNCTSSPCGAGGSSTPPNDIKSYNFAYTDGNATSADQWHRYNSQQPQLGNDGNASSTLGWMAWQSGATQYAETSVVLPMYWTSITGWLLFENPVTSGTVSWVVDTACVNPNSVVVTPTFGTPVTVTANVSSTVNATVLTAPFTAIATPGTNGCTAGTTAPGSYVIIRLHRGSDTSGADARAIKFITSVARSQ